MSNIVAIHSKYGKGSVILSASHQLGSGIAIFNKPEEGGLLIGAYEGVGNQVQIHDKYRAGGGVFLGTDKEFKNGRISIRDVAGELKWEAP